MLGKIKIYINIFFQTDNHKAFQKGLINILPFHHQYNCDILLDYPGQDKLRSKTYCKFSSAARSPKIDVSMQNYNFWTQKYLKYSRFTNRRRRQIWQCYAKSWELFFSWKKEHKKNWSLNEASRPKNERKEAREEGRRRGERKRKGKKESENNGEKKEVAERCALQNCLTFRIRRGNFWKKMKNYFPENGASDQKIFFSNVAWNITNCLLTSFWMRPYTTFKSKNVIVFELCFPQILTESRKVWKSEMFSDSKIFFSSFFLDQVEPKSEKKIRSKNLKSSDISSSRFCATRPKGWRPRENIYWKYLLIP